MAHFVDTNVVIYAFQKGEKSIRAQALIEGSTISVQVLNEVANVCLRKLRYNHYTLDEIIFNLRMLVSGIEPIVEETHDSARSIASRYKLGFYDSLLLASALLADCDTFYSEDLQHGLLIEEQMRVVNPFV